MPRLSLIACGVALMTLGLTAQSPAVEDFGGTWKAIFTGPTAERPKMIDDIVFTLTKTASGYSGTGQAEPDWPGRLAISDVVVRGSHVSFVGEASEGSMSNGSYHCCPKLAFDGTIEHGTLKLVVTWTTTEPGSGPKAPPVTMEARRVETPH